MPDFDDVKKKRVPGDEDEDGDLLVADVHGDDDELEDIFLLDDFNLGGNGGDDDAWG